MVTAYTAGLEAQNITTEAASEGQVAACKQAGRLDEALSLMQQRCAMSKKSNPNLYNSLIAACANGG